MPLVTNPPILVDATNFSRQDRGEVNPMGPFEVGSNLYLVLESQTAGFVAVYKSTDSGTTWVEQDSAHHPTPRIDIGVTFRNGIIAVLYTVPLTHNAVIKTFDTSTDTWGAVSAALTLTNDVREAGLYQKSDGTYVGVLFIGSSLTIISLAGGVWTGPTTLATVANGQVNGIVVDSSDRGHGSYSEIVAGAQSYFQISPSLTLSQTTSLTACNGFARLALYSTDSVAISYANFNQSAAIVQIGTPLSAPSFTVYTVATASSPRQITYPVVKLDATGVLTLFWCLNDFLGTVDEIDMATFNGAVWSSSSVFYDEITNPPPGSIAQPSQFVHTGDAIQLSNTVWVFSTAMEVPSECAGFVLVSNSTGPSATIALALKLGSAFTFHGPLRLSCPSQAASVGTFYSSAFAVSGGVPPYSFAIISGSLPPGLTLDPSTGVISGVPTSSGAFSFTGQVTDANLNVATTVCNSPGILVANCGPITTIPGASSTPIR